MKNLTIARLGSVEKSWYPEGAMNPDEVMIEHSMILQAVAQSNGEENLRESMKSLLLKYFTFGFGGSHMWVKQYSGATRQTGKEIIMVIF